MNNSYIYNCQVYRRIRGSNRLENLCVIFNPGLDIDKSNFRNEIKRHFEANVRTDRIIVFMHDYASSFLDTFFLKKDEFFELMPLYLKSDIEKILACFKIDKNGETTIYKGRNPFTRKNIETILHHGIQNIFLKNNGLIEAPDSFHFVFPSGKHCSYFLRTGNVLIDSSEISFIATALLKKVILPLKHIYCDTSSILPIAYSLTQILSYHNNGNSIAPSIHSFSSYSGIYNKTIRFNPDSLIIISASTSGNILDRLGKSRLLSDQEVAILYFIGPEEKRNKIKNELVCDLTLSEQNKHGIEPYPTFSENCELCQNNSIKIKVEGDSFLMYKPNVVDILLTKKECPDFISPFIKEVYINKVGLKPILKVNYKESNDPQSQYEIFIDIESLFKRIENDPKQLPNFQNKLYKTLDLYIPKNCKYLICLDDVASNYITAFIKTKYFKKNKYPIIVNQAQIKTQIKEDDTGVALVISSCIVSGRNILQVSRALRKYKKLRPSYISIFARTSNKNFLDRLSKTMRYGDTPFKIVQTIYCSNKDSKTSWIREIEFLKEFKNHLIENDDYELTLDFISQRIEQLQQKGKGLFKDVFLPNIHNMNPLKLRPNFAFLNFSGYDETITQSEVYFVLSSYINHLRHNDTENSLKEQSYYHRTVFAPDNFTRFNDGIIQASILRASEEIELDYSSDPGRSRDIKNIISNIITSYKEEEGEALFEFIYSLCIGKLKIEEEIKNQLFEEVKSQINNKVLNDYLSFSKISSH